MRKVICSSKLLYLMIENFTISQGHIASCKVVKISTNSKGLLILGKFYISVECKNEWELEFDFKKITTIKKILKKIPDQPLVIQFDESGIEILRICI